MLHWLGVFFIGLIVGIIAKLLMPGKGPGGFFITAIIGIVGAFVATFIGQGLGWYTADQSAGFIASIAGAIILLFVYRLFTKKKT